MHIGGAFCQNKHCIGPFCEIKYFSLRFSFVMHNMLFTPLKISNDYPRFLTKNKQRLSNDYQNFLGAD